MAIKLDYKIEEMDREIQQYSTPYNRFVPGDDEVFGSEEIELLKEFRDKLRDKVYWVVYYSPRGRVYDGDIGVFIDAETGEIIVLSSLKCSEVNLCLKKYLLSFLPEIKFFLSPRLFFL